MESKDKTPDAVEPAGGGETSKGPYMCPRCHRPVDPYDRNAVRDQKTRKWQHKDCRAKPRRSM